MPKEKVFIYDKPANPARWAEWEEHIGIGPKARARKREMREHVAKLAEQLKCEAEARELRKD